MSAPKLPHDLARARPVINVAGTLRQSTVKVLCESPVIGKLISDVLRFSQIQDAFEARTTHETVKVLPNAWE